MYAIYLFMFGKNFHNYSTTNDTAKKKIMHKYSQSTNSLKSLTRVEQV